MRCKTSCDCLGLRNICLLLVLHFVVNTALLSPSYLLLVCCYCLNRNQQIFVGINFTLREFLYASKGLWSPQNVASRKPHHCLLLG